jgi:hypothetical protein
MFEIERSRPARCEPARVMAILRDSGSWPAWRPEIQSVAGPAELSAGDTVEGDARMLGFHVVGRALVPELSHDRLLEDVVVGVRVQIAYEIRSAGHGAVVTSKLRAQLPGGPVGGLLSLILRWRLRRMQNQALDRLVSQSEAGSAS